MLLAKVCVLCTKEIILDDLFRKMGKQSQCITAKEYTEVKSHHAGMWKDGSWFCEV